MLKLIRSISNKQQKCKILYLCSSDKNCPDQKKQRRDKAIMALEFALQISKNQQSEDPLIDRLEKVTAPQWAKVSLKTQKQMTDKYFQTGLKLDDLLVFRQQRFVAPISEYRKSLFPFMPLSAVAPHMFRGFDSRGFKKKLIYGPYGVGKSVVIALYVELIQDIIMYRYNLDFQSLDEIDKQVLQEYQRKSFFNKKIFYYTLEPIGTKDEQDTKETVMKILRKQCEPELTIKKSVTSLDELCLEIATSYRKKQIKCDIIIDQINALTAKGRALNCKKPQSITKDEIDRFEKMKDIVISLNKFARYSLGALYLNSSLHIEKNLLGKTEEGKNINYALELDGHQQLKEPLEIPFLKECEGQLYKKELTRFLAKDIYQRVFPQQFTLSPQQFKVLSQQLKLPPQQLKLFSQKLKISPQQEKLPPQQVNTELRKACEFQLWKIEVQQKFLDYLSKNWNTLIRPLTIRKAVQKTLPYGESFSRQRTLNRVFENLELKKNLETELFSPASTSDSPTVSFDVCEQILAMNLK